MRRHKGTHLRPLLQRCAMVLVMVGAACSNSGKVTPTASPTMTSDSALPATTSTTGAGKSTVDPAPRADIGLKHDAGVTVEELDAVRRILRIAQSDLGDVGPVEVYAYSDLEELLASGAFSHEAIPDRRRRYGENGSVAEAGRGQIVVYMPNFRKQGSQSRAKILIHEYYHEVQRFFRGSPFIQDGPTRVPQIGPAWLIEGSAEFFGYRVADTHGFTSYADARQAAVTASRKLGTLDSYESHGAFSADAPRGAYKLGLLASEFLATRYGLDNLTVKYWRNATASAEWNTAFKDAFGLSVEEFYREFEGFRETLR